MFVSAITLDILKCKSMGIDSLLDPLLDGRGTAVSVSRKITHLLEDSGLKLNLSLCVSPDLCVLVIDCL